MMLTDCPVTLPLPADACMDGSHTARETGITKRPTVRLATLCVFQAPLFEELFDQAFKVPATKCRGEIHPFYMSRKIHVLMSILQMVFGKPSVFQFPHT